MLSPRLTNCVDCSSIPALLNDIDCRLTTLANNQYNNIVFSLNKNTSNDVLGDLLNYKRILTYKYCNPDYACRYTVKMIASRIKILIYK
jgi:hypothetical protein